MELLMFAIGLGAVCLAIKAVCWTLLKLGSKNETVRQLFDAVKF